MQSPLSKVHGFGLRFIAGLLFPFESRGTKDELRWIRRQGCGLGFEVFHLTPACFPRRTVAIA